jgi:hypothetical protein
VSALRSRAYREAIRHHIPSLKANSLVTAVLVALYASALPRSARQQVSVGGRRLEVMGAALVYLLKKDCEL